jgi:hypothetical protein
MDEEAERLVVQMAKENPSWGYDRIVGALKNLAQQLSHQTVGNILRRHGLSPAPKRKQAISWSRGAQPPGQRESNFVSSEEGRSKRWKGSGAVSGAAGRSGPSKGSTEPDLSLTCAAEWPAPIAGGRPSKNRT